MNRLIKIIGGFLIIFSLMSCRSAPNPEKPTDIKELQAIENAQKTLDLARYQEALDLFRLFQEDFSKSKHLYTARIGEMDSLIGMGLYNEGAEIGRDIIVKTLSPHPAIAATVMYKLSFAYEAMGDEAKAVSSLLDARKYNSELPPMIAYAELPARLASLYARQHRMAEVNQYLDEAEKGIEKLRETSIDREMSWLGKTYVQMGMISTNQLSAENYENIVSSQKAVQKYLLRALKLNDARWSVQALQRLRDNYGAFSMQIALEKNMDRQARLAGDFYDLIAVAKLYRPRARSNKYETEFFDYLQTLEKDTERILFANRPRNLMTPESEALNSIRRVVPRSGGGPLPEANKSSITPNDSELGEDPNL